MYKIHFYQKKSGESPVGKLFESLAKSKDKNNRINLSKINHYLMLLSERGTTVGLPYLRPILTAPGLYELRPLRNRIFFFLWNGDTFVLLHHFIKKSQATPPQEIATAKRYMKDYLQRISQGDYHAQN